MVQEQIDYASFLLRLWRAEQDGQIVWRASLESTTTGDRLNFANLEALTSFLAEQLVQWETPQDKAAAPKRTAPRGRNTPAQGDEPSMDKKPGAILSSGR